MIPRRMILAGLCLPLAALAQTQPQTQGNDVAIRRAVVQAVNGYILPGHAAFASATEAFAAATRAMEAEPTTAHAEAARQAWIAANLAFQRIRNLRFGPMDAFDRGFRISIFPDTRNSIGREMTELLAAADPANITEDAFRRGRIPAQGLPAAERLLFGDEAPRLLAADQGFRRALLTAIGRNLATIGTELNEVWRKGDPSYAQTLEGLAGSDYPDVREGSLTLFRALHGGIEFLADRQVARVLGGSVREARPRGAEAWRSGQSLALARASLAALADLYRLGFDPLLRTANAGLARTLEAAFVTATNAGQAITPSLEAAVTDPAGRAKVEAFVRALGNLRRLLTERAAPALGIPAGFNALDGD